MPGDVVNRLGVRRWGGIRELAAPFVVPASSSPYWGPYLRPVREVSPPSRPRGVSFTAPIRTL